MNPTRGKGLRYIYCPHEANGDCLNIVVEKDWPSFNCEKCEIYRKSEMAQGAGLKPENDGFVGARGIVPVDEQCNKAGDEMTEKCLVVDCESEGKHRGLCSAHMKWRKGNLPGVEPLPSNRGKNVKKDRLKKIKESAMRIKHKHDQPNTSDVAIVAEPVSTAIITADDVLLAENRGDYRRMAVGFINMVEKKFLQETFQALFATQSAEEKSEVGHE